MLRMWSVYLCCLAEGRRTPVEPSVISTTQFVAHAPYVCISVCLSVFITVCVFEYLVYSLVITCRVCWASADRYIFNVRHSYCARYWDRLDVCLSVRLSVTRWYCAETTQSIVKLSSLPGSPMILVFWGPNFFPEFQWEHSQRGVKCKG